MPVDFEFLESQAAGLFNIKCFSNLGQNVLVVLICRILSNACLKRIFRWLHLFQKLKICQYSCSLPRGGGLGRGQNGCSSAIIFRSIKQPSLVGGASMLKY